MNITTLPNAFGKAESFTSQVVTVTTPVEPEIPSKIIFKRYVAKDLIEKYGHRVIGIKQDRDSPERTIFVFEDSLKLRDDMQKIIRARRKHRSEDNEEE